MTKPRPTPKPERVSASSLLESIPNVVTEPIEEERPCRCGCWYCETCCCSMGLALRKRLIPILETFRGLMMLSLTIDPLLFVSPEAAYLYVRERRAISRLMQDLWRWGYLHTRRYFRVVEWQNATEMVHFHLLVDATHIPKAAIDRAWSKNRPESAGPPDANRPAFGMTRFSRRRFEGGATHAARYATKYLLKVPEQGWPTWVLDAGDRFRIPRYQTSRGFWPDAETREPSRRSKPTRKREQSGRKYRDRLQECGSAVNVFDRVETTFPDTGEVSVRRYWRERRVLDPSSESPSLEPETVGSGEGGGA